MAVVAVEPMRRRSKDRKAELLAVAAELFAQRGYAGVSVDDIGARVGITGPALYRHFRGKREVLTTILDGTMLALARAAEDPGEHPSNSGEQNVDALSGIIDRTTTVAMDAPAAFSVWLREGRHHDPATMSDFVEQRRRSGVLWHAAERKANPSLTRAELRTREEAVVAVINALAGRYSNVTRGRVEELAAAGAMATMLAPPVVEATVGRRVNGQRSNSAPWSAPRSRQDIILGVALPLFRVHGFAGVSMDQIGEAAGITGPSVYRYFDSKATILVDAFDRADSRVAVTADLALSTATSASEALRLLIGAYTRIALDSADLVVVTTRESQALPIEERHRQAERGRANADHWVRVLNLVRPELTRPEAKLLVRAMFGVVHQLVQLPKPPTVAHLSAIAAAVAYVELSDG